MKKGTNENDHSLPHPDEARMHASTTALGLVDHYKTEEANVAAKKATEAASDLLRDVESTRIGGGDNGGGNGLHHVDDIDAEDVDGDEEAPINPTSANKKKRKERYVCSYLCALVRYSALGIAGAALLVGLYFLIHEIIAFANLRKDNAAKTTQIQEMTEQMDLLRQGILDEPFKQEAVQCTDLASLTVSGMYRDGGVTTASSDPSNPNLPGFYGCVSNDAAATLLEAQSRVEEWSSVEAPSDLTGQTPDWIVRRIPDFGIWLYPRLKLILFSCPKCGNSESRTMLTVLSSMRQRTSVGDANQPDVLNWTVPMGAWQQESTDSWKLAGSFKGAGGKGMSGGDKETADAFRLVRELLLGQGKGNGGKWSSLSIVRHPYERFVEAYAELEALWSRLPDSAPQHKVLEGRPFYKMPVGSWERVQAFFADYVLGYLSVRDGTSNCLVSMLPELYSVVPTAAGYLRTGTGSGAYYNADTIISIDQVHQAWPDLLESWGFGSNDPALVELADVHLSSTGYGYLSGSDAAKAAQDLLASDEAFRSSIDAFYAQDFSCFGFQKGQKVLGIDAKQRPKRPPTPAPTGIPPPQDDGNDDGGESSNTSANLPINPGNGRF
eukprot:CAMPEP_0181041936 /NCGR_PEP_ID=MMETSP1070-20121207/11873_1 /TAXON_ID=265543 /ORGANISM="Minutocellus polymorphus, Strain NH13" /LENGTH=608 /DNA_ID=CAMNT_0023120097 /DNA_START=28 /DNA_END=1854 /DNA_ORIENTATION=+